MADNPYVGPRAFRRDDRYPPFGRQRETHDLRALVISEGAAVLYAESGAGKTSLVNALLVPELEKKDFEVLSVENLAGLPPAGVTPRNVYLWTLMSALGSGETDAGAADESLAAFLARRGEGSEPRRRVIILDQIEEMLSAHPGRGDERVGFFRELQAALEADPRLRVLLVIREDRIAELDDYARLFRHRLEGRLRIRRLTREAAVDALRSPAALAGRPFSPGVAEDLAEKLSMERVAGGEEPGDLVEPIVLQVVAYQLWSSVEERYGSVPEIIREHLEEVGDVYQALQRFYETAVAATARRRSVDEEEIRRWLGGTMITPQGLRAQVPDDSKQEFVKDLIREHHLLRPVTARGGRWIQLVHDRFVEPIRLSNARWLEQKSPVASAARELAAGHRDTLDRFRGPQLEEWLTQARKSPDLFSPDERSYLDAAEEHQRKKSRRARVAVFGAILASIVALLLFGYWYHDATRQEILFAHKQLNAFPEESLRATLDASDRFFATSAFPGDLSELLREGLYTLRSRPLWSHLPEDPRGSFAWSANGRRLAGADFEGRVTVWDTEAGAVLDTFDATGLDVRWLATSHDGTEVAVFGLNGAQRFRVGAGQVVDLADAPLWTQAAAFSPDGSRLAAIGDDGSLHLWETASGAPLTWAENRPGLTSLAWDKNGRYLATGNQDGVVALEPFPARAASPETFVAHRGTVYWLELSSDGKSLATAGEDDGVKLWNVETRSPTRLRHPQPLIDGAFTDDGHYLVTVTFDHIVHVWNRYSGTLVNRFPAVPVRPSEQPVPGGLSPNGRCLALRQGLGLSELFLDEVPVLAGHRAEVLDVTLSADGRDVATVGADRTLRLWRIDPTGSQTVVEGDLLGVVFSSVAFSRDGHQLASGAEDGTVQIWDTLSGKLLHTLKDHKGSIQHLCFDFQGTALTSVDQLEEIRVWDTGSGRILKRRSAGGHVLAVAAGPGGVSLAMSAGQNVLTVEDLESGETLSSFSVARDTERKEVFLAALAAGNRQLATADELGVRLWSVSTGKERLPPLDQPGQRRRIRSMAFSADGRRLVAADRIRILVWDTSGGRLIAFLPKTYRQIESAALSADGRYLATAGDDGLVHLDPLGLAELKELSQERLRHPIQPPCWKPTP